MIQKRSFSSLFCRRPWWAVLAWTDMSTLWYCPSSISSADHGITHPLSCPDRWFGRGCCGVWQARTKKVSISWQLPEVLVDPQRCWSYSAPISDIISMHQKFGQCLMMSKASKKYVQELFISEEMALSMFWLLECSSEMKCKTVESHNKPWPTWCVCVFWDSWHLMRPFEHFWWPFAERKQTFHTNSDTPPPPPQF